MYRIITLLVLLCSLSVNSNECHQDQQSDNRVDQLISETSSFVGTSPARLKLHQLESQIACAEGENRISVRSYHLKTSTSSGSAIQGNSIQGYLSPGSLSGNVKGYFVGLNHGLGDMIVIEQLQDNSINVHLSMCSVKSTYGGQDFLSEDTILSNVYLHQVVLQISGSCDFGNIVAGNLVFNNSQYGQDFRAVTSYCWQ